MPRFDPVIPAGGGGARPGGAWAAGPSQDRVEAAGGLPEFDVVILAGGRGARLGGADKPGLVVAGATMAATVLAAAVTAGARRAVVVGPERASLARLTAALPGGLVTAREDPPGAGPVPALRAGLVHVSAPWVALLAADLPFLRGPQVRELLAAAAGAGAGSGAGFGVGPAGGASGAVVADAAGAEQWLAGCWRTERLRDALGQYAGGSLRGLLGPLRPVLVPAPAPGDGPAPWLDCDTPAELAAARAWLAPRARECDSTGGAGAPVPRDGSEAGW